MYQLVYPTLLQSIAFMLWQIYLPKIVRQCGQLSSSPPGSAAHLWWAMMIGWVIDLSDEIQLKCEKSPPKSSKNEKLIFILHSTSDDRPSDPSNKSWPKCKKGPLSHQKLLVFGLCSTSGDQLSNESQPKCDKRPPKSLKNEILIFILRSTSDDRPSDPSDESWSKCEKMKCCFS